MSRDGAKHPSKETQESCQLSSLDGALYLKCSIQRSVQLIRAFLAVLDQTLEERHFLLLLLGAMRLDVFDF